MKAKLVTSESMNALAVEIIEFLQEREMFRDVNIYCNDKCFTSSYSSSGTAAKTKFGAYYIVDDVNVAEIIKYNNPNTITMTFEGPLYQMLNYGPPETEQDFLKLFNKHSLYYILDYAWSLTAYPM